MADIIAVQAQPNGNGGHAAADGVRRPVRVQVHRLLWRYGEDLTPDMIAAEVGVSRRHAARLIRQAREEAA